MRIAESQREKPTRLTPITDQHELEELLAGAWRIDVPYVISDNGMYACVASQLKKWRATRKQ